MSRKLHITNCWFLALLSIVLNCGSSLGLVVCIEDDGSIAIETPAAQAACLYRQDAARTAPHSPAGVASHTSRGCTDIPIAPPRGMISKAEARQLAPATIFAIGFHTAVPAQRTLKSTPGHARLAGHEPTSSSATLAALRSVFLLI